MKQLTITTRHGNLYLLQYCKERRILLKFVPCFIEINPKKYLAVTFRRNEKSKFYFSPSLSGSIFSSVPPPLPHVVCFFHTCTSRSRPLMPLSRGHRPTEKYGFPRAFPHHFYGFPKKKSGSTGRE